MTQEQKDLLLKDLCSRLPYGVWNEHKLKSCKFGAKCMIHAHDIDAIERGQYDFYKPYLFPLSSMTEEQKNDCPISETNLNIINSNIGYGIIEIPWRLSYLFVDWCNKNHFDYRGLIPMGLANDATGLNIY